MSFALCLEKRRFARKNKRKEKGEERLYIMRIYFAIWERYIRGGQRGYRCPKGVLLARVEFTSVIARGQDLAQPRFVCDPKVTLYPSMVHLIQVLKRIELEGAGGLLFVYSY